MQTLFYIRFSPIGETSTEVNVSLAEAQARFDRERAEHANGTIEAENSPELSEKAEPQDQVKGFLFSLGTFSSIDELMNQGFYQRCLNRLSGYALHLLAHQPGDVEAISYDVFDKPEILDMLMEEWRACFEKAGLSPSRVVDIDLQDAETDHEALEGVQEALGLGETKPSTV